MIEGSPLWKKKLRISKNFFFHRKIKIFFLNLYCTHSWLHFEVYNSRVCKVFKFWPISAWYFSFFDTVLWQPTLYENSFIYTYILADFWPSVVYLGDIKGSLMVLKLKLNEVMLKKKNLTLEYYLMNLNYWYYEAMVSVNSIFKRCHHCVVEELAQW